MDTPFLILRKYFDIGTATKLTAALQCGLDIIIDGEQAPTGKTTLCKELNAIGYNAIERWELPKKSDTNAAYIAITLNEKV